MYIYMYIPKQQSSSKRDTCTDSPQVRYFETRFLFKGTDVPNSPQHLSSLDTYSLRSNRRSYQPATPFGMPAIIPNQQPSTDATWNRP